MSSKLLNPFGLILLLVVFCSSIYGNSLEKALKENNLKLQLQSYYFTKAHEIEPKESIWVNGATVNYLSSPFLGNTIAGFTLQASDLVDSQRDDAKSSKFKLDMYGTGIALSEIYVAPRLSKTTLKLGRQYIKTPLVYGSDTRMVEQSFQGATLTSMDIKNTIISFIHLDKYQARTDGNGKIGKFTDTFDYIGLTEGQLKLKKGANSFYLINNSIKNFTLHYQYLDALDVAQTSFIHGIYNFGTPLNLKFTAQQYNTSWEDSAVNAKSGYLNTNTAKLRGYRLQGSIQGINFLAAYSKNDTQGDILGGLGLAADSVVTNAKVNGGAYLKNNSAQKFAIDTTIKGINFYLAKIIYKNKDNIYKIAYGADRYTETDFIIDYNVNKNLNLNFLYAKFGGNLVGSPNYDYRSRLKLIYSF